MLKSKIFILLSMILIVLILLTTNSSAYTVKYNNKDYDFGDIELLKYTFCYVSYSDGIPSQLNLFTTNSAPSFVSNGAFRVYYPATRVVRGVQSGTGYPISCPDSGYTQPFSKSSLENGTHFFVYSNFDILDANGEVVFQRPVPTLGEVLEQTNPVKTFQTMIHGIIISLTLFLVGLVAFWKAWSLLSKSLRKA